MLVEGLHFIGFLRFNERHVFCFIEKKYNFLFIKFHCMIIMQSKNIKIPFGISSE